MDLLNDNDNDNEGETHIMIKGKDHFANAYDLDTGCAGAGDKWRQRQEGQGERGERQPGGPDNRYNPYAEK